MRFVTPCHASGVVGVRCGCIAAGTARTCTLHRHLKGGQGYVGAWGDWGLALLLLIPPLVGCHKLKQPQYSSDVQARFCTLHRSAA